MQDRAHAAQTLRPAPLAVEPWGKPPADRLASMDKEALGRALGYGARHATKTLRRAAAAAAQPPASGAAARISAAGTGSAAATGVSARPHPDRVASAQQRGAQTRESPQRGGLMRGARAAGRSAWKPLATFTSVVWMQVTGAFFLLFALGFGARAWTLRHALSGGPGRTQAWMWAVLAAGFAYYAVSSFVRAHRRERQ